MVNVSPLERPAKCYACDAILDQPGRSEIPLCLKCRAGDGEKTPEVAIPAATLERVGDPAPWLMDPYRPLNGAKAAVHDAFFNALQAEHDRAYADAVAAMRVPPPVPSCRLCPAPAGLSGYCSTCWCTRLTELDRRTAWPPSGQAPTTAPADGTSYCANWVTTRCPRGCGWQVKVPPTSEGTQTREGQTKMHLERTCRAPVVTALALAAGAYQAYQNYGSFRRQTDGDDRDGQGDAEDDEC